MSQVKLLFVPLFIITWIHSIRSQEEYCIDESFNPQCGSGKIILMQSAMYGRMRVGRCLPIDLGYMGCQADALGPLDRLCSGHPTCNVLVADKRITELSGCMKGLYTYLQAHHTCVKGLNIPSGCTSNQPVEIEANESDFYLSDLQLKDICATNNKGFTITAKDGQVVNISQVNLQPSIGNDDVYGTVRDLRTDKKVIIGDGPREKHLLLSSSNELEIKLSGGEIIHNRFMLHVIVSGCPNMPPPDGAWMTRDSDVMEIGCHSGSKVWSLKCQDNQWVGAVGQCGEIPGTFEDKTLPETGVTYVQTLSLNALLFGICSLVILLSAVIFLVGVCLLKRKIQSPVYGFLPAKRAAQQTLPRDLLSNNIQTLPVGFTTQQRMYPVPANAMEPGCKSLRQSIVHQSTNTVKDNLENDSPPAYMNTTGSDASDSVKYFVLEDTAKYQ